MSFSGFFLYCIRCWPCLAKVSRRAGWSITGDNTLNVVCNSNLSLWITTDYKNRAWRDDRLWSRVCLPELFSPNVTIYPELNAAALRYRLDFKFLSTLVQVCAEKPSVQYDVHPPRQTDTILKASPPCSQGEMALWRRGDAHGQEIQTASTVCCENRRANTGPPTKRSPPQNRSVFLCVLGSSISRRDTER